MKAHSKLRRNDPSPRGRSNLYSGGGRPYCLTPESINGDLGTIGCSEPSHRALEHKELQITRSHRNVCRPLCPVPEGVRSELFLLMPRPIWGDVFSTEETMTCRPGHAAFKENNLHHPSPLINDVIHLVHPRQCIRSTRPNAG